MNVKSVKSGSPSIKLSKKFGKTLSDGKTKSIKEYFESLKDKDKNFPIDRAKGATERLEAFDNTGAAKKEKVKEKIETFESIFCVSYGDTRQKKLQLRNLKRLGDYPTMKL